MAFFASPFSDRDTRSLARSASTSGFLSKTKAPGASTSERVGAVRGARPPPPRPTRGPASTELGVISSEQPVARRASTSMESLGAELADVRLALQVYGGSDDGHSRSQSRSPSKLFAKDAGAGGSKTSLRAPSRDSRRSSRSPHGSRRKASTPTSAQAQSPSLATSDSTTNPNSLAHVRSSPDLPQRGHSDKGRTRPLLRTRTTSAANPEEANGGVVPPRPPRGPRPPAATSPIKGNFTSATAVKGTRGGK